jgi:hypothetical protein
MKIDENLFVILLRVRIFSRHARLGGHPGFRAQFFCIPAFAGMTDASP